MLGTAFSLVALALGPRPGTKSIRERLGNLIADSPGINEIGIQRETGLNRSSVRHHLRRLVSAGIIQQHPVGRENHYFGAGMDPEVAELQKAVAHGRARQVLREILLDPGIPQSQLAERVGMTRKTLGEYVDYLSEQGLLNEVRDARFQRYFPGESLGSILDKPERGSLALGPGLDRPILRP